MVVFSVASKTRIYTYPFKGGTLRWPPQVTKLSDYLQRHPKCRNWNISLNHSLEKRTSVRREEEGKDKDGSRREREDWKKTDTSQICQRHKFVSPRPSLTKNCVDSQRSASQQTIKYSIVLGRAALLSFFIDNSRQIPTTKQKPIKSPNCHNITIHIHL